MSSLIDVGSFLLIAVLLSGILITNRDQTSSVMQATLVVAIILMLFATVNALFDEAIPAIVFISVGLLLLSVMVIGSVYGYRVDQSNNEKKASP